MGWRSLHLTERSSPATVVVTRVSPVRAPLAMTFQRRGTWRGHMLSARLVGAGPPPPPRPRGGPRHEHDTAIRPYGLTADPHTPPPAPSSLPASSPDWSPPPPPPAPPPPSPPSRPPPA